MNEDMMELCAEAKCRQSAAFAASGQAQHQGFYIGEVLADRIKDDWNQLQTVKLIAQVVRDYKAVPDVLAEIADGLET